MILMLSVTFLVTALSEVVRLHKFFDRTFSIFFYVIAAYPVDCVLDMCTTVHAF